jgi:sarcosine oxidase, subunit beta
VAGRVVVAGAGAVGASVALQLAELGARNVVLCDAAEIASGATGKAMGGVRQQFSTAAEVRLAQASIAFLATLPGRLFNQVGYLFLATTEEGLNALRERAELQRGLGVRVEEVDAGEVQGLRVDDVLGAVICREDGVADPAAVTRELVRRASVLGVDVREHTDARGIEFGTLVVACGWRSAEVVRDFGVELPIRPLCRQLVEVGPLSGLPEGLPMVVEEETGFHFRRRDGFLRLAWREARPRWTSEEIVDESLVPGWCERLGHRYPDAAGAPVERAWAGLYDMTPDAHPIIGPVADGVLVAAGFSGHGFMQSPAVGRSLAQEVLGLEPDVDLAPYRLERFRGDHLFPEELVL